MKKTPLQRVQEEFGSKEALAEKLIPLLTPRDDETAAEFSRRIRTASNRKLLALWEAEQRLKDDFGGRDGLLDAIVKLKFDGNANDDYRRKLTEFTTKRLVALHDALAKGASA